LSAPLGGPGQHSKEIVFNSATAADPRQRPNFAHEKCGFILGTTNEQLGIMKLQDALRRAQSLGLDLVEVAPTCQPTRFARLSILESTGTTFPNRTKDRKSTLVQASKKSSFRVNIDPPRLHDLKCDHTPSNFWNKGKQGEVFQLQFRGREMRP